jgi:hypothetical protein
MGAIKSPSKPRQAFADGRPFEVFEVLKLLDGDEPVSEFVNDDFQLFAD